MKIVMTRGDRSFTFGYFKLKHVSGKLKFNSDTDGVKTDSGDEVSVRILNSKLSIKRLTAFILFPIWSSVDPWRRRRRFCSEIRLFL